MYKKVLKDEERFWFCGVYVRKVYVLEHEETWRTVSDQIPVPYGYVFDDVMFLIGGICAWILLLMVIVALWIKVWIG